MVSSCLYGFCDASKKAYAAVIYLVIRTPTRTSVQFVVAKTRVAPYEAKQSQDLSCYQHSYWPDSCQAQLVPSLPI